MSLVIIPIIVLSRTVYIWIAIVGKNNDIIVLKSLKGLIYDLSIGKILFFKYGTNDKLLKNVKNATIKQYISISFLFFTHTTINNIFKNLNIQFLIVIVLKSSSPWKNQVTSQTTDNIKNAKTIYKFDLNTNMQSSK